MQAERNDLVHTRVDATVWIVANCRAAPRLLESVRPQHGGTGAISLSSSSHSRQAELGERNPVALPPGRARLRRCRARPDRSLPRTPPDSAGRPQHRLDAGRRHHHNDVRRETDQFYAPSHGARLRRCRCGSQIARSRRLSIRSLATRYAVLRTRYRSGSCSTPENSTPTRRVRSRLLRARGAATRPPLHREHREIPAASCPPLGSGEGHRSGSNEHFDRGFNRLRYRNMKYWPMFEMANNGHHDPSAHGRDRLAFLEARAAEKAQASPSPQW